MSDDSPYMGTGMMMKLILTLIMILVFATVAYIVVRKFIQ